jgi:diguanylate cyclase
MGDRVLRMRGILRREQRSVDVVARYGGEEFVVLLPETESSGARIFAERILRRVANHDFGESGKSVRCDVSIGIATIRRAGPRRRVAAPARDTNLYRAKNDRPQPFRD